MKKIFLLFISVIIISSCIDPFSAFEFENHEPGTGSFSLTINNNTGRTILPTVVQDMFSSYTLEFTPVGITSNTGFSVTRTNENLSVPVLLSVGTWNLSVTAWLLDEDGNPLLAAQGSLNNIVISNGQTVTDNVILKPITNSGTGTFSWDIDYPDNVVFASMKITLLDETNGIQEKIFYFAGNEETLTGKNYSTSLDSGFYRVIFTLEDEQGKTAIRSDILHIYRNMESFFSFIFTENLFLKDTLTVILNSWDEDFLQWRFFDNGITAAHFIIANIEGVFDDNFDTVADWFEKKIKTSAVNLNELKVLTDFALIGIASKDTDFTNSGIYLDIPAAETAISALAVNGTSVTFTWEKLTSVNVLINDQFTIEIIFNGEILPPLIGIEIATLPKKIIYQLGEKIDLSGLLVNNIYVGNIKRPAIDYIYIINSFMGDTFIDGTFSISIIGNSPNFRGEWWAGGPFSVNDIVLFNGQLYKCMTANVGGTNPENSLLVHPNRWSIYQYIYEESFDITVLNQLVDTKLPVIYIETSAPITSTEDWVNGRILIKHNSNILYNEQTTRIRGRGNGTWWYFDKKPYRIKLDSATDYFGMGLDRDWVLLANIQDKTLLKTRTSFRLSELMNFPWTPKAKSVELVLNGEYVGNYLLVERLGRGEQRINISSTGYIMQLNNWWHLDPIWFHTDTRLHSYGYTFRYPDNDNLTENCPEFLYIKNYISELEAVLASDNFNDPETGYYNYLDINSFARWVLFQDIIYNTDSNVYLTKHDNLDSKLHMGPGWDFDLTFCMGYSHAERIGWNNLNTLLLYRDTWFYKKLFTDPPFVIALNDLWNDFKKTISWDVLDYISKARDEINDSQKLNFRRWYLNTTLNNRFCMHGDPVDCVIEFFNNRLKWLDIAINDLVNDVLGTPDPLEGKLLILQAYGSSDTANGASHSFVEIYNTTNTPISLNGISLYYADGTSVASGSLPNTNTIDGNWNMIPLSGVIPARGSYLVMGPRQNNNPAGSGSNNPRHVFPLNYGDINNVNFTLSNRAFKVALVRNTGSINVQNPFDINNNGKMIAGYIDMLGSANEYSNDGSRRDRIFGFETAPARNSASAAARRTSLIDTNNNSADFAAIDYRVTGTTDEQLSIFLPKNTTYGSWNPYANPPVSPPVPTGNKHLILQVGAATDGNINRSFVELYNNSNEPLDLTGYSLQYAQGTRGTPSATEDLQWQMIDFSQVISDPAKRIIPPRHSFLILGEAQVTAPADSPPALVFEDGYGDLNLTNFHISNRSFKVVLVNNTTPITVQNPFGLDGVANISTEKAVGYVDMVGAMNTVNDDKINGFEYLPHTPFSKQVGVRRASLIDTDNNSADFTSIRYSDLVTKSGGAITAYSPAYELNRPKNLAYGAWDPITGLEPEGPFVEAGIADPLAGHLLILQAYAPNSGAAGATHPFVELYNKTDTSINLSGINLYYTDGIRGPNITADAPWKSIALTGTIPAKGSFLVLGPNINPTAGRLKIENNSGDINDDNFILSNRSFKIAIIRTNAENILKTQNPFTMDGAGIAAGYIDMVGAANDLTHATNPDNIFGFEAAPARCSASEAVRRKDLTDTNNNSVDFIAARYAADGLTDAEVEIQRPRNSSAGTWDPFPVIAEPPASVTIAGTGVAANALVVGTEIPVALSALFAPPDANITGVTYAWTVTNQTPAGVLVYGAADSAAFGISGAVEGTATVTLTVSGGAIIGNLTNSINVTISNTPGSAPISETILILQANRFGNDNGGSGGFPRTLVELYNITDSPINLAAGNYFLHIGNATAWTHVIPLTGIIPAKSSYLIVSNNANEVNPAGFGRAVLPAADQEFNFIMPNGNFKIALLVNLATLLPGNVNPFTAGSLWPYYIDLLGATNAIFEGTAAAAQAAPQPPRRTSLVDTNNNSTNFAQVDYRGHWGGTARLPNENLHRFWPRNATMGAWNPITGLPEIHPVVRNPTTGIIEFPLTP